MKEQSTRTFVAGLAMLLLVVPMAFANIAPAHAATPEGIIIPLYTYPGSTWDTVIAEKKAHPSVPIVAIVNPSNGPGSSKDSNYASGIAQLSSAGVQVIGYVSTSYTGRGLSAVENDVSTWASWYPGISGIFFDEMSNTAGGESFYSTASSYAHSLGLSFTVGNPGANTIPSYLSTVNLVLIYESPGLPDLSGYSSWSGYDKSQLGMIPFGVSSFSSSWVTSAESTVGWLYVTNDVLPNPWDTVPPYLDQLATMFDTGSVGSGGTGGGGSSGSDPKLTVNSLDQNGNAVNGMWTTVSQNGAVVSTGFTPLTFSLASGSYSVTVANYGQLTFSHWPDGSTSSTRTVNLNSDASITAYYNNGQAAQPTTTTISVTTADSSGHALTGYYTTLSDSSGNVLQTQFSPAAFTVNTGQSYQVQVADYGQYKFSHWQDGSTSRSITVTPSSPVNLQATYSSASAPPPAPVHAKLSIRSVDSSGNAVNGLYATITNSANQAKSGFTPASFSLLTGQSYTVSVGDYGIYKFSHWDNGSTSRTRTVSITDNTSIMAYYSTS